MKYYKTILALLILFLLAGTFAIPVFGFELEARYLLLLLSSLLILAPIRKEKRLKLSIELKNFLSVNLAFAILLILTTIYSINIEKSVAGSMEVLLIVIFSVFLLYVIKNNQVKNHLDYLAKLWIGIGVVFLVPILLSVSGGSLRGQSIAGPNVSTRILFFAFGSAWFYWMGKREVKYAMLAIMFFAGIVLLGSRGGGCCISRHYFGITIL